MTLQILRFMRVTEVAIRAAVFRRGLWFNCHSLLKTKVK